jgi:hypothetical protein
LLYCCKMKKRRWVRFYHVWNLRGHFRFIPVVRTEYKLTILKKWFFSNSFFSNQPKNVSLRSYRQIPKIDEFTVVWKKILTNGRLTFFLNVFLKIKFKKWEKQSIVNFQNVSILLILIINYRVIEKDCKLAIQLRAFCCSAFGNRIRLLTDILREINSDKIVGYV